MLIRTTAALMLIGAGYALGAETAELRKEAEVDISAALGRTPARDERPPFVWAMSFSPDGTRLVVGVQFGRARTDPGVQAYLLVVRRDQPGTVVQRFEAPYQLPALI